MDKKELFLKRANQFWKAFLGSLTIVYIALLFLYKLLKLPIDQYKDIYIKLISYSTLALAISLLISFLLSFLVKRLYFPIDTSKEYWSYSAMKGYFFSYIIYLIPFFISFVIYFVFAFLAILTAGFIISFALLYFNKPKESHFKGM